MREASVSCGSLNRVLPSQHEMLATARVTHFEIATRSPTAVALCKEVLNALDGKSTVEQLALEANAFARAFDSDDGREGVAAFVAKRQPQFAGR
jgi:enoyl-CoA hydratase